MSHRFTFLKLGDEISDNVNEPIEPNKSIEEIRKEPLSLPQGFQWDTLNIDDADVVISSPFLANWTGKSSYE